MNIVKRMEAHRNSYFSESRKFLYVISLKNGFLGAVSFEAVCWNVWSDLGNGGARKWSVRARRRGVGQDQRIHIICLLLSNVTTDHK